MVPKRQATIKFVSSYVRHQVYPLGLAQPASYAMHAHLIPSYYLERMVGDRSGIHRAHKLASTLEHYDGQFQWHWFPAHCGHHLNPLEGFWRAMKDAIGAGRCLRDLHLLYKRTRQVLMAHQERPIYAFSW